jgi:hypothetical protein
MGAKLSPPDFGDSNGDGYLRIVEGQSTTTFGTTSFIDVAASWSYLGINTTLAAGQTWNLQFGSIYNGTDHADIAYDVAAGHNPGDAGLSWAGSITPIPEPSASAIVLGIISLIAAGIYRSPSRILHRSQNK